MPDLFDPIALGAISADAASWYSQGPEGYVDYPRPEGQEAA
jgi:hypothetical protein